MKYFVTLTWDKQQIFLVVLNNPLDTRGVPKEGAKYILFSTGCYRDLGELTLGRIFILSWLLLVFPGSRL